MTSLGYTHHGKFFDCTRRHDCHVDGKNNSEKVFWEFDLFILFTYLLNLYTVKKFIRYNSKKEICKILKSKILILLLHKLQNKLPTDLISMNAVYLKILIEKAFKLIYGTRFPYVTM